MARTTWELELKAKGGARAKALARDLRDLDAVLRSLGESSKVLKSISSDVSALRGARVRIRAEKSVGAETVRQQQRTARAFDENGRVRRAVEKAQARDARVASRAEAADQTERRRIGEGIDHPAVFPVGLPRFFIEAYTEAGEIVLEPFAGSGTTLLAGQITDRRVRAIELAPEYVDVALRRWLQHHPGMEPVLAATGQPFAEVAAERLGETAETSV